MAKKRNKKQKKRREMPPLSRLDKFVYGVLYVILAAAYIGLILLWNFLKYRVGFSGVNVIASQLHMSNLWAIPAALSLFFTFLGFWNWAYNGRRPIFGIPGFLYGPPLPKIYPLFMKNKPPKKPAEKSWIRFAAGLIIGLNLICIAFVPWSLQGRDSLHSDGTVQDISMFGSVRAEYMVYDTEEVILSVYSYRNSRHSITRNWSVHVELVMADGERFDFPVRCFRSDDGGEIRSWIRDLEQLLEQYPIQSITVERAEKLDMVIDDRNLSQEEAEILRRLFRID